MDPAPRVRASLEAEEFMAFAAKVRSLRISIRAVSRSLISDASRGFPWRKFLGGGREGGREGGEEGVRRGCKKRV